MPRPYQPNHERRRGEPAIPKDLNSLLTAEQRMALSQVESFGWRLAYVRHPLFQDTTIIVTRPHDGGYATLTEHGELEFSPDLEIRH